jgi:muramoyltetrapeptide carboxypeptidase
VTGGLALPAALSPGDRVAVLALSSPVPAARLDAGIAVLRSWGLEVVEGEHLRAVHPDLPYLSADDERRAADLTAAWLDPRVRAVLVGRGGYGVPRLLDLLDWDALAAVEPSVLMGFSDVTPLLHAVAARLGAATVHGPAVTGLGDGSDASRQAARDLLLGPAGERVVDGLEMVVPGSADGPLVGGNLALLSACVGDLLPADGAIVVLEDVDESPHRLDRTLTSLLRSGWLDGVAGVVLGGFTRCGEPAVVRALLLDRLGALGVPVAVGAPIGHDEPNLAVPIGAAARLVDGALTVDVRRRPR